MKKYILILLMLVLLVSCSCKGNKETFNFKTSEEITSLFNTYSLDIIAIDIAGKETKTTLVENNNAIFYQHYLLGDYIIDKSANVTFKLYESDNTKDEFITEKITASEVKKTITSYVTAHLEIKEDEFNKLDTQEKINGILCDVYEELIENNNSSSIERYYVATEGGYCIKRYAETKINDATTSASWEIKNLSFDESSINNKLDLLLNTGVKIYKKWPSTHLSKLIDEFTDGIFSTATELDNEFYAYYKNVDFSNVNTYKYKIISKGFTEGKSFTDELNQYTFIAYNDDNIMVKLNYNNDSKVLAIRVIKSSYEDIQKEIASLE